MGLTVKLTNWTGSKDGSSDPHVIFGIAWDQWVSYSRDNSVISG